MNAEATGNRLEIYPVAPVGFDQLPDLHRRLRSPLLIVSAIFAINNVLISELCHMSYRKPENSLCANAVGVDRLEFSLTTTIGKLIIGVCAG